MRHLVFTNYIHMEKKNKMSSENAILSADSRLMIKF